MLWTLIARFVKPAWPLIVGIIVFQAAQSIASLLLPTLNADIIDKGVVTGDIGYIWSTGGIMLAISAVQVSFAGSCRSCHTNCRLQPARRASRA
mgnify:CR=1 FL=1